MSVAKHIILAAGALTSEDRAKQHGAMDINHIAIAAIWNGYLNARAISERGQGEGAGQLGAEDVANMMELLKVARRLNGAFNIDDYVDGAGYAAVAGQLAADAASAASLPAAHCS